MCVALHSHSRRGQSACPQVPSGTRDRFEMKRTIGTISLPDRAKELPRHARAVPGRPRLGGRVWYRASEVGRSHLGTVFNDAGDLVYGEWIFAPEDASIPIIVGRPEDS